MSSVIDSNPSPTEKKGNKLIFKIIGLFNKIDQLIASTSLALIVILTIYGVVMRYVVNSPSAWVEEVCLALFVCLHLWGQVS